jgi:hypothetical protein
MSNDRYYVVGDCDMWCIQYAFAELAECTSRSKVIAFAIGAAQRLGMRGERAHVCVLDRAGHYGPNGPSTAIGRGQAPDDFLMRRLDLGSEFRQRIASGVVRKSKATVFFGQRRVLTRRTSSPLLSNLIFRYRQVLLRPFRAAIRIFPRAGCLPAVTCGTRSRADRVHLQ